MIARFDEARAEGYNEIESYCQSASPCSSPRRVASKGALWRLDEEPAGLHTLFALSNLWMTRERLMREAAA